MSRRKQADPYDKGEAPANPCKGGSHGFCLHTAETCSCSCHPVSHRDAACEVCGKPRRECRAWAQVFEHQDQS